MAGDLIAGLRQGRQLRPGQVPGRVDTAAIDVEGRRETMGVQQAGPLVHIGIAVVELDGHDGQRRRAGGRRAANRQPAASAADATARDRHPGIQNHPVMIYSSGRRAIWMAASATRLRIRRRGLTRPL
jgi:hypothetical protein